MQIDLSEAQIKLLFYLGELRHVGTDHDTCRHVGFIKMVEDNVALFECLDCDLNFESKFTNIENRRNYEPIRF